MTGDSGTDLTMTVDAGVVDRVADLLDADPARVAITLRSLLPDLPGFEMRTRTWRVDLPTAVARSVVSGVAGATVLQQLGGSSVPAAILAAVASLAFTIRRVEVTGSEALVLAQLHAVVGTEPRDLTDLYLALPAGMRAELTLRELADVIDQLVTARLVVCGPDGLRVRPAGAARGFRLALWDPPRLPSVLRLREAPAVGSAVIRRDEAAGPAAEPAYRPRVFVSYAHESTAHKELVARFCRFLVGSGVDVRVDRWHLDGRREWDRWAEAEIVRADFVLVIASPTCRAVGDGDVDPNQNLGLQSEFRVIRELYNRDRERRRTILPVLLPGARLEDVPLLLQPTTADRYEVAEFSAAGANSLLKLLSGEPVEVRPPLGDLPGQAPR